MVLLRKMGLLQVVVLCVFFMIPGQENHQETVSLTFYSGLYSMFGSQRVT